MLTIVVKSDPLMLDPGGNSLANCWSLRTRCLREKVYVYIYMTRRSHFYISVSVHVWSQGAVAVCWWRSGCAEVPGGIFSHTDNLASFLYVQSVLSELTLLWALHCLYSDLCLRLKFIHGPGKIAYTRCHDSRAFWRNTHIFKQGKHSRWFISCGF